MSAKAGRRVLRGSIGFDAFRRRAPHRSLAARNVEGRMDADAWQREVGLNVDDARIDEVRSSLESETAKEARRQGSGDTELMRLCCVQLFNRGLDADVLAIWRAKAASMDAGCAIDIQLLCGPGLARTKAHLAAVGTPEANRALARIVKCEECGDFEGFDVEASKRQYEAYYGVETAKPGSR